MRFVGFKINFSIHANCIYKERTSIINNSSNPEWNKQFVFKILYPLLIRCLKIELCAKNVFQDDILATEYIYLDDLSHPRITNGSLPFYGNTIIIIPYYNTMNSQSII